MAPRAAVEASRNVAGPVTEARDVAEAGAVAVAAICGVDRSESLPEARGARGPNIIILALTCPLNGQMVKLIGCSRGTDRKRRFVRLFAQVTGSSNMIK